MAQTAKLFWSGRSQAVRLPKEFRMTGDEVRIRKHWRGCDSGADCHGLAVARRHRRQFLRRPSLPEGRNQPPLPADRDMGPAFE